MPSDALFAVVLIYDMVFRSESYKAEAGQSQAGDFCVAFDGAVVSFLILMKQYRICIILLLHSPSVRFSMNQMGRIQKPKDEKFFGLLIYKSFLFLLHVSLFNTDSMG